MGATFGFLLGYAPGGTPSYLYSLLFAFVGAAIFSISRLKDQRVPQEAIIGITFAVASAATILIASRAPEGSEFVEALLTGALLWVPWSVILKTGVLVRAHRPLPLEVPRALSDPVVAPGTGCRGGLVGTVVSMVGLALSYAYDFPSGPAVVVTFRGALVWRLPAATWYARSAAA